MSFFVWEALSRVHAFLFIEGMGVRIGVKRSWGKGMSGE